MEVRFKAERASEALYRLVQAYDSAMETPDPAAALDNVLVSLVRGAFNVKDVSRYKDRDKLPKNWASDSLTSPPLLMHPVFGETAPLQIGSFKATGSFAARTRHLMRSGGKQIWRLAIISIAMGQEPGVVALTMGAPSAGLIRDEEFIEMSQTSGFSIQELEAAELVAHTKLAQLHGIDVECVGSDRTELREELLRTTGGV